MTTQAPSSSPSPTPPTATPTALEQDLANSSSSEARTNLFPQYLMKLLNDEVAPNSLWWLPDGAAFAICPDKIAEEVLDKHFQKTKYSSFIRRLHNEGYRRQTRKYKKVDGLKLPEGTVVLSHDSFQRSKPELLETFYKKGTATTAGNEPPKPNATALHQARAESKVSQTTQMILDTPSPLQTGVSAAAQAAHLKTAALPLAATQPKSSLAGLAAAAGYPSSALGRMPGTMPMTSTDLSHFLGSYPVASLSSLGPTATTSSLTKGIAALRAARTDTTPATASTAALLESQIRLQQFRWEQSRRELEEQTSRLSAMEALRLRAAAFGGPNGSAGAGTGVPPQWR